MISCLGFSSASKLTKYGEPERNLTVC